MSAGFCVTGSEDQYLRVWPLDFSEFLIEAKHEGVLISLDISQDALSVACGTSTGGLGILDLSNQNYKTFLRSHTEEIITMELHPFSNYLITLSQDLTIRIWYFNQPIFYFFIYIKRVDNKIKNYFIDYFNYYY